jgi:hypothetical protein
MMVNLSRLKIITFIVIFLTFLQYLYLYPVKLNLSAIARLHPSYNNSNSASYPDLERTLFYFRSNANSKIFKKSSFDKDVTDETVFKSKPAFSKKSSSGVKNSSSNYSSGSIPIDHDATSSSASSVKPTTSNSSDGNPNSSLLPLCATRPSTLLGLTKVSLSQVPSLAAIGRIHSDLSLGGHFKPPDCRSKDRVAIIVPFRDREEHLRAFLFNLIPTLKRQQIEFNIFIVEQGGSTKDELFNRAMLFNVGFVEANKRGEYDCFIFHDVDLIPENDYNLYNCPVQPRHMSVAVDKMKYKLPYRSLFGGISALTKSHFEKVNGFSNSFWGWGGEDDDMAGRIAFNGLYISRPPPNIARYKMLKHKHQKLNNQRYRILQKGKTRFKTDGLSNLKYTVEQLIFEKTYTLVRVQLAKV